MRLDLLLNNIVTGTSIAEIHITIKSKFPEIKTIMCVEVKKNS